MLPVQFVYLASLLNIASIAAYVHATLTGRAKPNRVTWFMWGLAPLIACAAQLSSHVGISTLFIFTASMGPLIIFACSFVNQQAYWKMTTFDLMCGALSLLALIFWGLSRNPNLAIVFSMLGDFCASIPTLRKAYTDPQSEDSTTFLISLLGAGLGILCIQQATFSALAFTIYLTFNSGVLCLLLYRHRLINLFEKNTEARP